jgi:hypothetical protein
MGNDSFDLILCPIEQLNAKITRYNPDDPKSPFIILSDRIKGHYNVITFTLNYPFDGPLTTYRLEKQIDALEYFSNKIEELELSNDISTFESKHLHSQLDKCRFFLTTLKPTFP